MTALKRTALLLLCLASSINISAQMRPLDNYKLFFEKVYLHTDRELYTGGEDIWFKAYLLNAQNDQPIGTSNNLYVELISPQATIVHREIVRMDYGIGNSDFKLSDSIAAGTYRLRAYTNWMRNFGDNFIFEKSINIVNPNGRKEDLTETPPPVIVSATPTVRFYPEGGSLIEGVTSLVAVKAENYAGKSLALNGVLVNAAGDTITNFKTDTLGMGLLTLLPVKGQVYHAVFKLDKITYNTTMPAALTQGFTLGIMRSDTLVDVVINANDITLAAYMGKRLMLSGKHGGILCLRKPVKITGNQTVMRVPKSFFPDGITDLTLFDAEGKPQSERLIYVHQDDDIQRLTIATDKTAYKPREKVNLTVKLRDTTAKASLSIAVVDGAVAGLPAGDIQTYLMLQSELKGKIEHPERYFDIANTNRLRQMDMLLLTQGWRDFVWRKMADTAISVHYNVENSFTVSGKVRRKFADDPIPGMNITLTAFRAKGQKLYSAKTDSAGRYKVEGLQLYGSQAVTITALNNKGNRAGWLLMDSLATNRLPVVYKPLVITDTNTIAAKLLNGREHTLQQIAKSKLLKEVKITDNKPVVLREIAATNFGYPAQVFNITKKDEYYEALDNWLAHNVKGAVINDKPGVQFLGYVGMKQTLLYPRFVINSEELFVQDPSERLAEDDLRMNETMRQPFFDLTMDKIKKVEVRHLVGMNQFSGSTEDVFVVFLTVTPNAFENKDFGIDRTIVSGYYEARKFYKPMYEAPDTKTEADLRTTIHWEPNMSLDANCNATISFYNADPKTNVRVIVQGITDKGVPVTATAAYTVK